jgi:hypothetical protein
VRREEKHAPASYLEHFTTGRVGVEYTGEEYTHVYDEPLTGEAIGNLLAKVARKSHTSV